MKAFVFPGQGAQFVGMGKELYENSDTAKQLFEQANQILGFRITDIMFAGTDEELKQTKVTQPAVFLHSVISAKILGADFQPDMVAGHSLGEFSALVAAKALTFEDGLKLVAARAQAMQKACEINPSTMAAILGLEDEIVEKICKEVSQSESQKVGKSNIPTYRLTDLPTNIVVPANYNCVGQLVISGTFAGVELACAKLKENGAKRALMLQVGGGFHSPCMQPAKDELEKAILNTNFSEPICPIYQNVDAKPHTNSDEIKQNLIAQLIAPVRWTQSVQNMAADGATHFAELGPGNVLQGLIKKIAPEAIF